MSKRNAVSNFSYRSGCETAWRCPRAGYLEQHYMGTGIQKYPQAYWLSVGSATHIGLAELLTCAAVRGGASDCVEEPGSAQACIQQALDYWDTCGQREVLSDWQFHEQRVLIEALLWAFYYHTLPVFLETYEVLWVEKEITEIVLGRPRYMMMSRPDAIVRERATGELVVISWKTIDDPTDYRRLFFKQDLQGMMEQYYSERWLRETYVLSPSLNCSTGEVIQRRDVASDVYGEKIAYVQTIYLVKGKRTRQGSEGEEGETFADEQQGAEWRQDSFLVYPYVKPSEELNDADAVCTSCRWRAAHAPNCPLVNTPWPTMHTDEQLAWSYRYRKPGNTSFSTLGKAFKKTLVTDTSLTVQEWVKALHEGSVFPTGDSPLSKVIVWEKPSVRDQGMMESVVAQVKETERRRHRDKKTIERSILSGRKLRSGVRLQPEDYANLAQEEPEYMPLLDKLFPQYLTSCNHPWRCSMTDICHTEKGRHALYNIELPEGFQKRRPHHAPEAEYVQVMEKEK